MVTAGIGPAVIGRRIEVIADLHCVRALCDGRLVGDPEHVAAAKLLRRERIGVLRPSPEPGVQIRCLADYDTLSGSLRRAERSRATTSKRCGRT